MIRVIPLPSDGKQVYELLEDTVVVWQGVTITIPRGFQYNGASIPRPFWPLIGTPFAPGVMRASAFHDWVYLAHQLKRSSADRLLRDLLREDGVSRAKAFLMFAAVRLFGGLAWKNRPAEIEYLRGLRERLVAKGCQPAELSC